MKKIVREIVFIIKIGDLKMVSEKIIGFLYLIISLITLVFFELIEGF